jgi:hypothetical protein
MPEARLTIQDVIEFIKKYKGTKAFAKYPDEEIEKILSNPLPPGYGLWLDRNSSEIFGVMLFKHDCLDDSVYIEQIICKKKSAFVNLMTKVCDIFDNCTIKGYRAKGDKVFTYPNPLRLVKILERVKTYG